MWRRWRAGGWRDSFGPGLGGLCQAGCGLAERRSGRCAENRVGHAGRIVRGENIEHENGIATTAPATDNRRGRCPVTTDVAPTGCRVFPRAALQGMDGAGDHDGGTIGPTARQAGNGKSRSPSVNLFLAPIAPATLVGRAASFADPVCRRARWANPVDSCPAATRTADPVPTSRTGESAATVIALPPGLTGRPTPNDGRLVEALALRSGGYTFSNQCRLSTRLAGPPFPSPAQKHR